MHQAKPLPTFSFLFFTTTPLEVICPILQVRQMRPREVMSLVLLGTWDRRWPCQNLCSEPLFQTMMPYGLCSLLPYVTIKCFVTLVKQTGSGGMHVTGSPPSHFHIYGRVSLVHHCSAKDYNSQVPLQPGVAMWLSSGQWNMSGNDVGNFQVMPLIKESREHTSLSLSLQCWWLKPEQPSWTMRWRTQYKRRLNPQPCEAAILNSNHLWVLLYMWPREHFPSCLCYFVPFCYSSQTCDLIAEPPEHWSL